MKKGIVPKSNIRYCENTSLFSKHPKHQQPKKAFNPPPVTMATQRRNRDRRRKAVTHFRRERGYLNSTNMLQKSIYTKINPLPAVGTSSYMLHMQYQYFCNNTKKWRQYNGGQSHP